MPVPDMPSPQVEPCPTCLQIPENGICECDLDAVENAWERHLDFLATGGK